MNTNSAIAELVDVLQVKAQAGQRVDFWLRDDDAVEPCVSLDRLLALCDRFSVPLTLAVIPAYTDDRLAQRLAKIPDVSVAVHGWSHSNYARVDEKKQELGNHRPQHEVLAELMQGFAKLAELYPGNFVPLLVPPWNRLSVDIVEHLSELGFIGLSTFGDEIQASLVSINSQVDIMDWKGTRGGRPVDDLFSQITKLVHDGRSSIGILTHQLVHDATAWQFLEQLFDATSSHPGASWLPVSHWLGLRNRKMPR